MCEGDIGRCERDEPYRFADLITAARSNAILIAPTGASVAETCCALGQRLALGHHDIGLLEKVADHLAGFDGLLLSRGIDEQFDGVAKRLFSVGLARDITLLVVITGRLNVTDKPASGAGKFTI